MELYYNPEQMKESEIKDTFVARQWMLDELLSIARKQPVGAGVQHVLILGPRGMGKTTMLLMLRFGILESELSGTWTPVRFPEESYSITDVADFWISVIAHLSHEVSDPRLLAAVDGLKKDSRDSADLAGAAVASLKNWSKANGRRIVILVDNFDLILEQIRDENENARLREVLMNDGTFMLVGTATSFFKEARAYERPLYNFFKTYDLTALNEEQVDDLLLRRAAADQNAGFKEHMRRNAGRIRVLRYFTGGSPRLVLMLYRIVANSEPVDAMRGLEKLLDEVTPYYKAKIEILPPQQRKILDNLARVSGKTREGLTPTQLAEETRLPVNQVSSQLKRLSELGYVAAANVRSRNSYYSLAEPLYAIWHQMRFGRQRLGWLVNFLRGWYSEDEGLTQCARLAEAFKGVDAARMGEALDIRRCFVDALPDEYRSEALDRFILDCLDVGQMSRAKEILSESDLAAITNATLSQLKGRGIVSAEQEAAFLTELKRKAQDFKGSAESGDSSRILSAVDGLRPLFQRLPALWLARGAALCALGRMQEALHDYDAYLAREQNEEAEWGRARILFNLYSHRYVLEFAESLIERNPNSWSARVIRAVCLEIDGQFDAAIASWRQAIEKGAPDWVAPLCPEDPESESVRSIRHLVLSLAFGDEESSERAWREVVGHLGDEVAASTLRDVLRLLLAPRRLDLLQRLIKSTPAKEILLPLARAIDYLISRDRIIIEKLSAEVRPIVEEIVAEYEKNYPPEADVAPRKRTRKAGAA